jgi:hypothetical protein
MADCKHRWRPKPMWDLFTKHQSKCMKCGFWKCIVVMKCKDGKWRPRWKVGAKL